MPLWVLSSTGIALAVVGCCMLLARALPRLVWPAVALGQLALTVYVAQVLVLAARPPGSSGTRSALPGGRSAASRSSRSCS
jgi:hypothetical protein